MCVILRLKCDTRGNLPFIEINGRFDFESEQRTAKVYIGMPKWIRHRMYRAVRIDFHAKRAK
jgi:hypothetical protein